ncbi:membrane lipoprotein lipid attachment site-containing protein [Domibacillus robiginosus]|uniref:membrane lipoprotein lipid attachment site-containing protein n=1 Tax=Domibacillus robiginosus TaxID=1071054 RepID=UPI00067DC3F5|nr:membrane lipoprotein lipid attachment site-containing protein [Domibacillus robiginosus]
MKKIFLFTAFIFLLSACNSTREQSETGEKKEPARFDYELNHDLYATLEFHTVANDGTSSLLKASRPYTIPKGTPVKVVAAITNKGEKDFVFEGNPCSGKLTVSVTNNEQTFRLSGQGNVTPDVCTAQLVTHTLKKGETLEAEAVFETDYDELAVAPEEAGEEPSMNPFNAVAAYGEERFSSTFEIEETNE